MSLDEEFMELATAIRNGDGARATLALDLIAHDLDCRIMADENGGQAFDDVVANLTEKVAQARAAR